MGTRKLAFLISTLLLLCLTTIAQTQPSDPDPEKEKKKKEQDERVVLLLEQAIGEGSALRLAQNRAIVFAISGDLFWKFDEKRSRELFRNSAAELLTANQESDKEKRESQFALSDLLDFSDDSRGQIFPLIATRDAELALELLIQTRPAKLAEAMARVLQPGAKAGNTIGGLDLDKQRVNQEIALEQRIALLAADENPEKAIKLIKDSLAKGISSNVLPLLQKLNKKDEKKAAELARDVIKKIVDTDLAKSDDDMRVALNFLQFAFKPTAPSDPKEKTFSFSEELMKDLANKVTSALLEPSKSMAAASFLTQAMPMLEKFVPEKVALLKQRQTEAQNNLPPEFKSMQQMQKLYDANSTPEDIIAAIPKLQNDLEKMMANQSLVAKIGQIEDEARAKKLIDQIPDEKTRASAQEQFEAARIGRSAGAGKLDEARKLIGNLTKKKTQIQRLVGLALEFQKKGGEKEVAAAKSLMKDAKALTNEYAETNDDIADVMEVVKGYASVDQDSAFRMFEPIIDRINEHVQATAVLARFNPQYSTFKKGEIVFKINGNPYDSPLFRFIPHMQLLGKADLERMNGLADRFGRNDSKAIVKLYVLQGLLKDVKTPEAMQNSGMEFIFGN